MQHPSPAPKRRRRADQADIPYDSAHHSDDYSDDYSDSIDAPIPSHTRKTSSHPSRASYREPARKSSRRSQTFLESIPTPLRLLLITLCLAVFMTSAVGVTSNFLKAQEERRRLEAEAAERAQHPLKFADLIVQYASAQDLDPALVSAVILCESSFNPQAESRLGARGLMQLMEDTAGWVAHKLDEDDDSYSFDLLYDAETSIRFGTWYLGYLNRRFDGDATKVVCAYHAGQGNVDAWLKNPKYSSDGVTLDVIPTDDTSAYCSRVLRARDVYRKYYFPVETTEPHDA